MYGKVYRFKQYFDQKVLFNRSWCLYGYAQSIIYFFAKDIPSSQNVPFHSGGQVHIALPSSIEVHMPPFLHGPLSSKQGSNYNNYINRINNNNFFDNNENQKYDNHVKELDFLPFLQQVVPIRLVVRFSVHSLYRVHHLSSVTKKNIHSKYPLHFSSHFSLS